MEGDSVDRHITFIESRRILNINTILNWRLQVNVAEKYLLLYERYKCITY